MRTDEARALADHLNAAAAQAEAEGRQELLESDLDGVLAGLDDALGALRKIVGDAPANASTGD